MTSPLPHGTGSAGTPLQPSGTSSAYDEYTSGRSSGAPRPASMSEARPSNSSAPKPDPRRYDPDIKPRFNTGRRKRLIVLTIVVVLLSLLCIGGYILLYAGKGQDKNLETASNSADSQGLPEDTSTIRMLATGDWIAHDAINQEAETDKNTWDYAPMAAGFKKSFAGSDINFCNQATLAGGTAFGISGYPVFNAPLEWIGAMKGLGCNVINTGTNHTNDKGQAPITAQLDEWDKQNVLAVAGSNRSAEEQNKVRYFEVKGFKFALLSYSTYSNAPNPNPYSLNRFEEPLVSNQMKEARANADVVMVSMRWGTEYSEVLNAAQDAQSQKLSDLGADIILGHGTHTLQPVKRLAGQGGNETIVWYGLGNFLNAQLETTGLTGCVAAFTYDIPTKKFVDSTCLPFYQHYEWTAEEKAAGKLLARKNFRIMPLYEAQDYMAKSQLGTTVEAQTERIQNIVNTYTKIPVDDGRNTL